METIKLLVISWKGCPPCEAMKKAKTVERFQESYDDVEVEHHTLPPDWPDLDGASAAERLKLLGNWSEAERTAVRAAEKYDMQGAPLVAFVDGDGDVIVEADGAVNLTQLKDLYQEALEAAGEDNNDEGNAA
jgi:thioredoxin-related protein